MIWIHGGGFLMGGASLYDGSSLAAFGDVVVVILQYRLGIPGFLRYTFIGTDFVQYDLCTNSGQ